MVINSASNIMYHRRLLKRFRVNFSTTEKGKGFSHKFKRSDFKEIPESIHWCCGERKATNCNGTCGERKAQNKRTSLLQRATAFALTKKEEKRREEMPRHDAPSGTMVRERACECAARNRVILLSSRSIGLEESHSFELGPGMQTHAHVVSDTRIHSVTSNRAATAFRRHENCLL